MNITRDIKSLSEFKQNASKTVKRIQETKEPVVLTVNGKAAVVVQDAETYQRMKDREEYAETVFALRVAATDMGDSSKWLDAGEVFSHLRSKFNLK